MCTSSKDTADDLARCMPAEVESLLNASGKLNSSAESCKLEDWEEIED